MLYIFKNIVNEENLFDFYWFMKMSNSTKLRYFHSLKIDEEI